MKVDVIHATADAQDCVALELPDGATAGEALLRSGLVAAWSLDKADLAMAIGGRPVGAHTPLADGDRLELLRPVAVDPKDARRRRAATRARRSKASS